MQAIILAAGSGTRLASSTDQTPKALVKVGGVPIVQRVVRLALQVTGKPPIVVVSSGYRLHNLREGQPALDYTRYVYQDTPAGTAAALYCVALHPATVPERFLVMGCDTLFPVARIAAVARARADIVLSVRPGSVAGQTTLYYVRGKIAGIVEKSPQPHSDYQSLLLYALPPQIFDYLPRVKKSSRGEYEIQDAINMMIDDGASVATVECDDYFHLTQESDIDGFGKFQELRLRD